MHSILNTMADKSGTDFKMIRGGATSSSSILKYDTALELYTLDKRT